jgi:hypothetical protein
LTFFIFFFFKEEGMGWGHLISMATINIIGSSSRIYVEEGGREEFFQAGI